MERNEWADGASESNKAGAGADRGMARRRRPCGCGAAARRPCGRRGSRPPPAPSPPAPAPPSLLLLLLLPSSSGACGRCDGEKRSEPRRDGPGTTAGGLRPVNKGGGGATRERRKEVSVSGSQSPSQCRSAAEGEEWREGGGEGETGRCALL